jgi:hypothetical protein
MGPEAAISDNTFIETHDPNNVHQAMGATIHKVVHACMHDEVLAGMANNFDPDWTLVHVEAGKRIYQLYAELDQVDNLMDQNTLAGYFKAHHDNGSYQGPWAFRTLGSAGGQTVVGALTTGTHGGDFRMPPIADSVMALHLGTSFAYNPHPDPNKPNQPHPTMLEIACADSSFLRGILKAVLDEIGDFIDSNGVAIGASIPAVSAAGGSGLLFTRPVASDRPRHPQRNPRGIRP